MAWGGEKTSLHWGWGRPQGTKEAFTVPSPRRLPPAAPVTETWGAEGPGRGARREESPGECAGWREVLMQSPAVRAGATGAVR